MSLSRCCTWRFMDVPRVGFWLFHASFTYSCTWCFRHRTISSQKLFTRLVLAGANLIFIIPFQPSQLFQPSGPNGLHSLIEEMMRQEITEREPHKLQPHIVHHSTTNNRYIVQHNTTFSSSHHQNSSEPRRTGGNCGRTT